MNQPEANTKFLARYFHRGSWWVVEIYAVDWDDAETICRKLSLRLDGECKMKISIPGAWFPNLILWLRDRLRAT